MKKLNTVIFFIAFLISFKALISQNYDFICGSNGPSKLRSLENRGGLYLTSEGTVNAIIVYVQFKDDWDSTAGWPTYINENEMSLPPWAFDLAGKGKGITKYFDTMSKGKLNINATVYPELIVTEKNSDEYSELHDVNYDVIKKIDVGSKFRFTTFDTWSGTSPGSDGVIDLIFIIYRHFPNSLVYGAKWTGFGSLWLPVNGYYSEKDGKKFLGGLEKGSGIQMRAARNGLEYTMFQAAHELGHKLFGAGHIQYGLANLSLMGANPVWNSARGMCAWEREKLGWIDYVTKDHDEIFELKDYMQEDVAVKIKLPNLENEFFILENRQQLVSEYDKSGDTGVYIYHVKGSDQNLPEFLDVECADGNYNWEFDETTLTVTRLEPDPYFGKDEMNYSVRYDKDGDNEDEIYGCFINGGYFKDAAWGDRNDAFDDKYNNVFSPVSNPPSNNSAHYPFTVEILENINNSGTYKVRLYYENAYEGKPAKPFGLQGYTYTYGDFGSTSARGTMKWEHYDYDDHDEYEVYRAVSSAGEPELSEYSLVTNAIGTSMTPLISEEDYGDNNKIYYRIKAKDSDGNLSIFSDSFNDWAPPSVPTMYISRSSGGHPVVNWSPAESNDVDVYLRKRSNDVWESPFKVSGTSYEDVSVDWPLGHLANEADFYYYAYKQRREKLQSPQSIILNSWGEGSDWMFKEGSELDGLPKVYEISQNYPNPFNPTTLIEYQLPKDSHVLIRVYDILGNEVGELVNETQKAGYHKTRFDGGGLSSGMYIYFITAGDFSQSKKMVLIK